MATILEALDQLADDKWQRHWHHPAIRRYLTTGDSKQLAKIPAASFTDKALPSELLEALLISIDKPSEHEARLLRLCVEKELTSGIWDLLIRLNSNKPGSFFKLTFRDVITNKRVAKVPDSAPAAVKTEFKELSAGLKEAVKSQLLRMETLMVRQFRWPVGRWKELYLQHPLLLPFAQRLVWGAHDKAGRLAGTFRTLEDRSLTNAADESCTLPNDCGIGIVHPLELTSAPRQAWLKHLADYDVVPPFAQLERPVVTVKPEQKGTKFGNEVSGTELNAMTLKGRAERLGWTRGSVCDAGCISFYLKSFPTAGVDVFVGTDGMYVGIDMYSDITLGKVFFVKHGSVQIGSYVYDEPGDAKDSRLVSYDQVPPIAFSEAMGDLVKIAGKESDPTTSSE